MTTKQILYEVKRILQVYSGETIEEPIIIKAIQKVQQNIIKRTNCLSLSVPITTQANIGTYPLFQDGRDVIEIIEVLNLPAAWRIPLTYVHTEQNWDMIQHVVNPVTAYPQYWRIRGNNLLLLPAPTEAGLIITAQCKLRNSTADVSYDINPEIQEYWEDGLIAGTVAGVSLDQSIIEKYDALFEVEILKNQSTHEFRTNQPIVIKAVW